MSCRFRIPFFSSFLIRGGRVLTRDLKFDLFVGDTVSCRIQIGHELHGYRWLRKIRKWRDGNCRLKQRFRSVDDLRNAADCGAECGGVLGERVYSGSCDVCIGAKSWREGEIRVTWWVSRSVKCWFCNRRWRNEAAWSGENEGEGAGWSSFWKTAGGKVDSGNAAGLSSGGVGRQTLSWGKFC